MQDSHKVQHASSATSVNLTVGHSINQWKYECTIDQELADAAA